MATRKTKNYYRVTYRFRVSLPQTDRRGRHVVKTVAASTPRFINATTGDGAIDLAQTRFTKWLRDAKLEVIKQTKGKILGLAKFHVKGPLREYQAMEQMYDLHGNEAPTRPLFDLKQFDEAGESASAYEDVS